MKKRFTPVLLFFLFLFLPFYSFPQSAMGDDCNSALPIPGIPFSTMQNTCGNTDLYNEVCPLTPTGAPDMVFVYTPASNETIDINLCTGNTDYDTKIYIYENNCPLPGTGATGSEIACNEDACANPPFFSNSWVSQLLGVPLLAGNTYYIVVDGYDAAACGNFTMDMDTTGGGSGGLLTRDQAVQVLLNPGLGGLEFDTMRQAIWSPSQDFGFGFGFEGLLEPGTTIRPAEPDDTTGSLINVQNPSYLFWVDNFPFAELGHETWFLLMDATLPLPSIFNGGIQFTQEQWWPVINPPGSTQGIPFFETQYERATSFPPGPFNNEGLISGPAMDPGDILITNSEPTLATPEESKSWGLLIVGSTDQHHRNNGTTMDNNMRNHYGVDSANIIRANNGAPATKAQVCAAIDRLADSVDADCDKIYIRMTSHGLRGIFNLPGPDLTAAELCQKLQPIAAKGVPICMIINACFSGTLLDANNWNFPAGSSIITSANDTTSYGRNDYMDGTTAFNLSLFTYAFSKCLNDTTDSNMDGILDADTNRDSMVDDCEAYNWMITNRTCVTWRAGDTSMLYVNGAQRYWDPMPQKRTVGRNPRSINILVKNFSGATKTDFHLIFKNDVRGGVPIAWRADSTDKLMGGWAREPGNTSVTYDSVKNETMVCWIDTDDQIQNGEYVHFGYRPPRGGLKPVRQYWTPTPPMVDQNDRAPATDSEVSFHPESDSLNISVVFRSEEAGGWGDSMQTSVFADIILRASPTPVPLEGLSLGDPLVSGLPPIILATGIALVPDQPFTLPIPVPGPLNLGDFLILERKLTWGTNGNTVTELAFFDPFGQFDTPPDCGKDTYEPNDEFSTPSALFNGAIGTLGKPTICPAGDVDYFSVFSGPGTQTLRVRLLGMDFDGDLSWIDPVTGTPILVSANIGTQDEVIEISDPPVGNLIFCVSGKNNASSGTPYELTADFMLPTPPGLPPIKPIVIAPLPIGKAGAKDLEGGFTLYPNPAQQEVSLLFEATEQSDYTISVYNMAARKVHAETRTSRLGRNDEKINLEKLGAGIYFIEVRIADSAFVEKLIIE